MDYICCWTFIQKLYYLANFMHKKATQKCLSKIGLKEKFETNVLLHFIPRCYWNFIWTLNAKFYAQKHKKVTQKCLLKKGLKEIRLIVAVESLLENCGVNSSTKAQYGNTEHLLSEMGQVEKVYCAWKKKVLSLSKKFANTLVILVSFLCTLCSIHVLHTCDNYRVKLWLVEDHCMRNLW